MNKLKTQSLSIQKNEKKIKILIIGDSGIGKTSLISRYVRDKYIETYISTIGIDFQQKQVVVDARKVHLQIWDTAGQERFHTITKAYYRGTQGIIIAFSLTDALSFKQLQYWMKQIQQESSVNCAKILVGTKSDMIQQRSVSLNDIGYFTEKYNMKYIETSSKLSLRVNEAFQAIASQILSKQKQKSLRTKTATIQTKTNISRGSIDEAKKAKKISC